MPEFRTIARVQDVPETHGLVVQVDGRDLAVFKIGDAFSVLDAHCPHKGGPLALGCVENGKVYCPLHGWDFELATGICGNRPDKSVDHFESRVVDGEIQIYMP